MPEGFYRASYGFVIEKALAAAEVVAASAERVQSREVPVTSAPAQAKYRTAVDLDKLAIAVAAHETCGCTCGVGKTHNNCFGIRYNGDWAWYPTHADSFTDFKRIWAKSYKIFPTLAMAKKYSGNDRSEAWLETVTKVYDSL